MRARRVVLATGAIERPLVFPGNDRPGILLAGAAQTYLNRYGAKVGNRVMIITADDAAYQAALDLHAAGTAVSAIADLRSDPRGDLPQAARRAGLTVLPSTTVESTEGNLRLHAVRLAAARGDNRPGSQRFECDALLMSGGFTPSVHLFSQSRGKLGWDEALQAFVPGESAEHERSAGACRGILDLQKPWPTEPPPASPQRRQPVPRVLGHCASRSRLRAATPALISARCRPRLRRAA